MTLTTPEGATAIMSDPQNKPFWCSAWVLDVQVGSFECHFPWWVSGYGCRNGDDDLAETAVVFAVFAKDEDHAKQLFTECFDDGIVADLNWRFVEPTETQQVANLDRFPMNRQWMVWPE